MQFTGHGFEFGLSTIAQWPWSSYLHLCASVIEYSSMGLLYLLTNSLIKFIIFLPINNILTIISKPDKQKSCDKNYTYNDTY